MLSFISVTLVMCPRRSKQATVPRGAEVTSICEPLNVGVVNPNVWSYDRATHTLNHWAAFLASTLDSLMLFLYRAVLIVLVPRHTNDCVFMCACIHMCVWMHAFMCMHATCVWVPMENRRENQPSGAGVTGSYRTPNVSARTQTLLSRKSSKCSYPLNNLPSLKL